MSTVKEEREIATAELPAAAAEQSPVSRKERGKKFLKRKEKLLTQFRVKISLSLFFKTKLPACRVNELIDFNKQVVVQGGCAVDSGV